MTEDSPSTPPHAAEQQSDPWRKHRIWAGILTVLLGLISAISWLGFAQQMSFVSGVMSGHGPSGVSVPFPVVAIVLGIVIGGLMFCGTQGWGRPMVWLAAVTTPLFVIMDSNYGLFGLILLAISAYLIWVLRNTKPAKRGLRLAASRLAVGLVIVLSLVFGDLLLTAYKKSWEPSERLHGLRIDMSYEDVLRLKRNPDFCRPYVGSVLLGYNVPDFYSGIRHNGEFVCTWVLESGGIYRKRDYPNKNLQVVFAECHVTEIRADNLGGFWALSHPRDENSLGLPFNSVSQMHEILGKEDIQHEPLGTKTAYSYTDWGVSYVFDEDLLLRAEIGDTLKKYESKREDRSEYTTVKRMAESGDAEAQASIGYFYLGSKFRSGIFSPRDLIRQLEEKPDYAEAAKWFRLAAEQGHVEAYSRLAGLYAPGMRHGLVGGEIILLDNETLPEVYRRRAEKGVPQDLAEAAKWYQLSAEQGYKESMHTIGAMYATGTGVPQDNILAYMWLYLAHEQRYTGKETTLSDRPYRFAGEFDHHAIADHMTADDISTAQAKAHEWLEAHMAEGCRSVPATIN